ncbi:MAG: glycosyltransferase family 1 protein [Candidatus Dormiibacterota bacterium]
MLVAVDTSVTDFDRGGTSRYVESLLPRLKARPDVEVVEVSMARAWPWTQRLPRASRILVHDLRWIGSGAVETAKPLEPDLWHGVGFKVPATPLLATSVTIHDDTPWDHPPTARLYNRVYMRRNLERAAPYLRGAITGAESTAKAIADRLPAIRSRIHVTPWGVDHDVFRPRDPDEVEAALARRGIRRPYVLMVSPYGRRKNQPGMMDALSRVAGDVPGLSLVIVGRANPGLSASLPVVETGRVADDDLAALYSGAEMLIYVSVSEGFGLPVLEAMACGCPVLGSRGTVIEEIGGGAAALADADSIEDITAQARKLLGDPELRQELGQRGIGNAAAYDWDLTAELTEAAWREML